VVVEGVLAAERARRSALAECAAGGSGGGGAAEGGEECVERHLQAGEPRCRTMASSPAEPWRVTLQPESQTAKPALGESSDPRALE
jgi:hypothetical protein